MDLVGLLVMLLELEQTHWAVQLGYQMGLHVEFELTNKARLSKDRKKSVWHSINV